MTTLLKKARLADALLERHTDEVITGFVIDARVITGCLVGQVYKMYGYADGERLVSGEISEIAQLSSGRWLVKTRELDCLSIVNFGPGGRQSLLHLVDLFSTARIAHSRWCMH